MNELTAAHTKLVRLHSVSVEQCNHSSVVSKTEKTSLIIITIISLITFIITAIINISGVLQQIHRRCCCQANRLSGKKHMCLLLLPSLPLFFSWNGQQTDSLFAYINSSSSSSSSSKVQQTDRSTVYDYSNNAALGRRRRLERKSGGETLKTISAVLFCCCWVL